MHGQQLQVHSEEAPAHLREEPVELPEAYCVGRLFGTDAGWLDFDAQRDRHCCSVSPLERRAVLVAFFVCVSSQNGFHDSTLPIHEGVDTHGSFVLLYNMIRNLFLPQKA